MAYVLLLAIVAMGIPLAISLRDRVDAEVRGESRSQANLVAASAAEFLAHRDLRGLTGLVDVSAGSVRGRVVAVDRGGTIIADSGSPRALGRDYSSRPEIAAALRGRSVQDERRSATLGAKILATAVPVIEGRRPVGAIRITQSVTAVDRAVRRAITGFVLLGGVVLALALLAGALIAREIARPIRRLDEAAHRIAAGDLTTRAAVEGSSEQRSLAQSFNEMTGRIDRLLRSQRDFVADASHQLRTPLTGLRLQLEEARHEAETDEARAAALDAGLREVDRLAHIVEELLILGRAGERELPGEEVDLVDAGERAVERWSKTASDRGIVLEHQVGDAVTGRVWCARADLDRALDAIVENAIVYSSPASGVVIVNTPRGIEVLDRGPGIAGAEGEAIFHRFYRGEAGRKGGDGTGLGLSIASELTREWGGSVTIENRSGGGARAILKIPDKGPSATQGDGR